MAEIPSSFISRSRSADEAAAIAARFSTEAGAGRVACVCAMAGLLKAQRTPDAKTRRETRDKALVGIKSSLCLLGMDRKSNSLAEVRYGSRGSRITALLSLPCLSGISTVLRSALEPYHLLFSWRKGYLYHSSE